MANVQYSQVTDLITQGKLNWPGDLIEACLVTGAILDEDHKKFSELGVPAVAKALIQGRTVAPGGELLGYPVFFPYAEAEVAYQVLITQDSGDTDPNLLAWYDTAEDDGPLQMENTGTFIIRPQATATVPVGTPTESRVWMRVPSMSESVI